MPVLDSLPSKLENVDDLLRRRGRASEVREMWRSLYQDCFRFAMPSRETFSSWSPGQNKVSHLYDSTLQENTYEAANTLVATLFPPWERWAELSPGAAMPKKDLPQELVEGLQGATETFFGYLHSSNFSTVINETALDLMVGTGSLAFDEGDDTNPFVFTAVPLSHIEIEEGPNGMIETTFQHRKPKLRNLLRMYQGMEMFDLPSTLAGDLESQPEREVEVIQIETYYPEDKHYYGIVIELSTKLIIWRYDYGTTCPMIVARATKVCGETYGRGRVMRALADARSLDKMVEFVLRQAALQVAPPLTGVSDGVLNPYTATLAPNTIIPVASNDTGAPSLRALELGGNFNITQEMVRDLRERIRREMLGPEMSQGPIKTATEITISDRNRLWAMNGEFARIQSELLAKIIARGVSILQSRGLLPPFKLDGREITIRYTSPFARSQENEDVMALQTTTATCAPYGPNVLNMGLKTEDIPAWVARKTGLDMSLVRSPDERKELMAQAAQAVQQMSPEDPAAAMQMAGGG